jgi:hypothetical protein
MRTRTRIAITVASALVLGVTEYGRSWTAGDPGLAPDLWQWGAAAAYALAIVGVAIVKRWWALAPALAPTVSLLYLESFTDYAPPPSQEREPLVLPLPFVIVVFCLQVALQAAVLAIGFLLRLLWDAGRRRCVSRRGRAPSLRG